MSTTDSFDLTATIAPRSDQANADDFISGPRTFTVAEVRKGGSAEQPVEIVLAEFDHGRPFKPSKTVRRILVAAWGTDSSVYVGRRMTLYRDPEVRFGGSEVGGIRISHLSHIDKPLKLALTVTRGKRAPYVVQPLVEAPVAPKPPSMGELFTQAGIAPADRLAYVAQVIGREIATPNDLTADESAAVIDALAADIAGRQS